MNNEQIKGWLRKELDEPTAPYELLKKFESEFGKDRAVELNKTIIDMYRDKELLMVDSGWEYIGGVK